MRILTGVLAVAVTAVAGAACAERLVIRTPTELRAGPDPLYLPERGLSRGTAVEVLEHNGGWAMVRLPDGMEAWVPEGAMAPPGSVRKPSPAPVARAKPAPTPPVPPMKTPYASVVWPSAGALNLRSGPGTEHDVIRPMERGDWVEVQEADGAWVKLRHISGDEGWAYRAYLIR